jgi:hypothetical protein
MRLPVEVKVWRKAERTRLISEREALPIERRRAARERVRAILATEVPELRRVDSGTRRNGLSKADLDVSAKLPEQCLDRGEESEAFPGRQIVGEDDLLQLGVAQGIEVEIARQVTP